MKGFAIFLALLVTGFLVLQASAFISQSTIESFVNLTQALKYNDSCSWSSERARQSFARDSASQTTPNIARTMGFIGQVTRENMTLCASTKMVICDRNTQRCKCGDPARELFPRSLTNWTEFVVETGADGKGKCRWAEGGYCFSTDILEKMGLSSFGVQIDAQCQQGTQCVATGSTTSCTFYTLVMHIATKYPDPATRSMRRLLRDIFKGQVCKCQRQVENPLFASSDEEEWGRRRKRSVSDWSEGNSANAMPLGSISPLLNTGLLQ